MRNIVKLYCLIILASSALVVGVIQAEEKDKFPGYELKSVYPNPAWCDKGSIVIECILPESNSKVLIKIISIHGKKPVREFKINKNRKSGLNIIKWEDWMTIKSGVYSCQLWVDEVYSGKDIKITLLR